MRAKAGRYRGCCAVIRLAGPEERPGRPLPTLRASTRGRWARCRCRCRCWRRRRMRAWWAGPPRAAPAGRSCRGRPGGEYGRWWKRRAVTPPAGPGVRPSRHPAWRRTRARLAARVCRVPCRWRGRPSPGRRSRKCRARQPGRTAAPHAVPADRPSWHPVRYPGAHRWMRGDRPVRRLVVRVHRTRWRCPTGEPCCCRAGGWLAVSACWAWCRCLSWCWVRGSSVVRWLAARAYWTTMCRCRAGGWLAVSACWAWCSVRGSSVVRRLAARAYWTTMCRCRAGRRLAVPACRAWCRCSSRRSARGRSAVRRLAARAYWTTTCRCRAVRRLAVSACRARRRCPSRCWGRRGRSAVRRLAAPV